MSHGYEDQRSEERQEPSLENGRRTSRVRDEEKGRDNDGSGGWGLESGKSRKSKNPSVDRSLERH